ncbi:MAG TPA: FecR domain-containing protein [Chitinophaga sp.]|uniref:FecR family protein n=1 Tax=Chitinophaga sp. TaxID=1869181 RepID=UPI002D0DBF96|nr:FecR domain-containing protein [Chitinophaga sp.]HVI45876.1 FecR domain-containing protein [Chitinophaga sp.]
MEKNNEYYQFLLRRWQERLCTPQEALELMDYLQQEAANRTLLHEMRAAFGQVAPDAAPDSDERGDRVREALLKQITTPVIPIQNRSRYRGWFRPAVAAAVLAALLLSTAWLVTHHQQVNKAPAATIASHPNDIAPGKNKAVLTLANGEKIVLDSTGIQQLAQQGNSTIMSQGGQLVYVKNNAGNTTPVYNTLTTGPGETYPLVLADGSRIWLNAASSLRFPAAFADNERLIELAGEAYFEIAHDAHRPFKVKVNNMTVDVLGTHFNINSYPDEATINTTLLEGAVKISSSGSSLQLAPGEQSQVNTSGNIKKVTGVNTDEIISWKEGYFQFDNTDLTSVLRQFSHWYNVEIVYEGNVRQRKFFGMVSRNSSLMNVLKMLNANDISFRLEGKKLIVQKSADSY